jgi:hypothetical protein
MVIHHYHLTGRRDAGKPQQKMEVKIEINICPDEKKLYFAIVNAQA